MVLGTIEVALALAAWWDLARRPAGQVRGPKWRWAIAIAVNVFGPLAYFRWGRVPASGTASLQHPSGSDAVAELVDGRYLLLTTYRRDGTPVPTPVWFAQTGEGELVVQTGASTGKLKRIRRDPNVAVARSDARGKPKQEAVPAIARILEPADGALARRLLESKYGLQWRAYARATGLWTKVRGRRPDPQVYLAVRLQEEPRA